MSQRLALAVDGAGLLPVYLKLNPHFVFHLDRTAANGHRGDFKLSLPQPRRTADRFRFRQPLPPLPDVSLREG